MQVWHNEEEQEKEQEGLPKYMDSIITKGTWEITDLPVDCKPVGRYAWIFKKKLRREAGSTLILICLKLSRESSKAQVPGRSEFLDWHRLLGNFWGIGIDRTSR